MNVLQKKSLANAALIVMSSIVVSRITGFVREMLVPNAFGLKETADAYSFAFKITGLMYDMLVGGAIAAALIPVLSGYVEKRDEEDGWKAVGTFINVVFVAMCLLCALGITFAPFIVPILAPGFSEQTNQLMVRLVRILFPSVAFLMLAGLANGVLNSYRRFAAASYGPTIYNIGSILSILLLSKFGIETVAVGVMCSSLFYFLFQLSFAMKNLKYYRVGFFLKHPGFIKLIKLAIPSLVSSSIVQINVVISSSFSSLFTSGSVAAFNIADRLWQLPYGIFAQGMGIAMLPTLSANLAAGEKDDYKFVLNKGLKTVLLFSIPSAVGFVVLRVPIVRTILKFTRKISEADVALTGNILVFFSIALITHSIVAILNRAFYACNDTKTPLFIGSGTIILNIILSYVFYKTTTLNAGGMALAYSLASFANAVLLLLVLDRKLHGIGLKSLKSFLVKSFIASAIMGALLYFVHALSRTNTDSKLAQIIYLAFQVLFGALIYFAMAAFMKIEEALYIYQTAVKKLKRILCRFLRL